MENLQQRLIEESTKKLKELQLIKEKFFQGKEKSKRIILALREKNDSLKKSILYFQENEISTLSKFKKLMEIHDLSKREVEQVKRDNEIYKKKIEELINERNEDLKKTKLKNREKVIKRRKERTNLVEGYENIIKSLKLEILEQEGTQQKLRRKVETLSTQLNQNLRKEEEMNKSYEEIASIHKEEQRMKDEEKIGDIIDQRSHIEMVEAVENYEKIIEQKDKKIFNLEKTMMENNKLRLDELDKEKRKSEFLKSQISKENENNKDLNLEIKELKERFRTKLIEELNTSTSKMQNNLRQKEQEFGNILSTTKLQLEQKEEEFQDEILNLSKKFEALEMEKEKIYGEALEKEVINKKLDARIKILTKERNELKNKNVEILEILKSKKKVEDTTKLHNERILSYEKEKRELLKQNKSIKSQNEFLFTQTELLKKEIERKEFSIKILKKESIVNYL